MSTKLDKIIKGIGKVILNYHNKQAVKHESLTAIKGDFDELLADSKIVPLLEKRIAAINKCYGHRLTHLDYLKKGFIYFNNKINTPPSTEEQWTELKNELVAFLATLYHLRNIDAPYKVILAGETFELSTTAAVVTSLPSVLAFFGAGHAIYSGNTSEFGRSIREELLNYCLGEKYKPDMSFEDISKSLETEVEAAIAEFRRDMTTVSAREGREDRLARLGAAARGDDEEPTESGHRTPALGGASE